MTDLHGAPDYFQYRRDAVTFPLADLAELAAKLGALSTVAAMLPGWIPSSLDSSIGQQSALQPVLQQFPASSMLSMEASPPSSLPPDWALTRSSSSTHCPIVPPDS
ncbi:hypothetical protein ES708_14224 [subsurface metagenome]